MLPLNNVLSIKNEVFFLVSDGLPAEDLQVHVDYDLAKQLHGLWARTLTTRFEQEEEEVDSMIKAGKVQ